jgi:hydroxymethylglutaryl-CoA lyase
MEEEFKMVECPRDAWQGLPQVIPTAEKAAYLRALVAAGFRHIDAVSFVSPRRVPQMADSEKVMETLLESGALQGVEIIGIVVNEKGLERALATPGVTTAGYPYSLSPTFQRQNANQSPEEARQLISLLRERTEEAGRGLAIYLSMAFGNPYGDPYSPAAAAEAVDWLRREGVRSVSLADTAGTASAADVRRLFEAVRPRAAGLDLGLHLHTLPDQAAEKVRAACEAGCRRLDGALTGLGGCPFAGNDLVGNLPTERALATLASLGVACSPSSEALAETLSLTREIANRYGH